MIEQIKVGDIVEIRRSNGEALTVETSDGPKDYYPGCVVKVTGITSSGITFIDAFYKTGELHQGSYKLVPPYFAHQFKFAEWMIADDMTDSQSDTDAEIILPPSAYHGSLVNLGIMTEDDLDNYEPAD